MNEDLNIMSNDCNDSTMIVLEQWKTCVEAANGITEKRHNSNNIFITINTALFTVISLSWDLKSILLSLVGIVICILWLFSIDNYRKLNIVKYEIINEIEKQLPVEPFKTEWKKLHSEQKYIGLTKIENVLPCVFIGLFAFSVVVPIIKILVNISCHCIGG